jgi:hypothetical protein
MTPVQSARIRSASGRALDLFTEYVIKCFPKVREREKQCLKCVKYAEKALNSGKASVTLIKRQKRSGDPIYRELKPRRIQVLNIFGFVPDVCGQTK